MSLVRILAACHDPGGTMAMCPVLRRLHGNPNANLHILAGVFARPILDKEKLEWRELSTNLAAYEARGLLEAESPQVLFSATSWASNAEQQLRNEAAALGIPSIVLLDYWSNYGLRWDGAAYPIESLSDFVAVMDEKCQREMLKEGFPKEKVVAAGHPYLEQLFSDVGECHRAKVPSFRVLFISLPLPSEHLKRMPQEHVVTIAKALVRLAKQQAQTCELTVKLHPKESRKGWAESIEAAQREGATVHFEEGSTSLDTLITESNIVIGFASMALLNARAAGKPVFSLDEFPVKDSLRSIYDQVGIKWCKSDEISIEQALVTATNLKIDKPPQGLFQGATVKVEELVLGCSINSMKSTSAYMDAY